MSVYNLSTFISSGFYIFETSSYVHCLVYSGCFIPSNVFYPLMQFQSKLILTKMYNHFAVSKWKPKQNKTKMKNIYKLLWTNVKMKHLSNNYEPTSWNLNFLFLVSAITSLAWSTAFSVLVSCFFSPARVNRVFWQSCTWSSSPWECFFFESFQLKVCWTNNLWFCLFCENRFTVYSVWFSLNIIVVYFSELLSFVIFIYLLNDHSWWIYIFIFNFFKFHQTPHFQFTNL